MIERINDKNLNDAAKVYMLSWRNSHKEICSAEFIEKHDIEYMTEYLKEKNKE